ncbi:hypothetical protein A676_00564 [Salmonella enterica subsp. enterica serovar Enteritidis str. 2010K-0262]|uniref:Uncharacterized protein n=1 Tax=Salmonella enteritidis (strain 2009K0958) TaxID=1192586 RepID=A0A656IK42_SALE2|nr:hypothetical protein A673_00838 [Salmonella enterica subsp. enterica serovar Enteritidis str. 2009K0958]EPI90127.1 hypothetical protein A676_00564 [Salmonella enterica subsp. enterica serovar Enteritidis str. 2010K-0262]EPI92823.1 hypothetical protein A675_00198 [Salmonella enterica subsp. enterica serovar Enteritidis str. 2009K1726]EPI97761.1 hypothetical protein A679_03436 [Salmonella enterica subsp. enterica serovar Enteritidis str. 2010K-0284]EPJ01705.1 hypothetical protein A677_01511 [S
MDMKSVLQSSYFFINGGFIVASDRSWHRIRQADCERLSASISHLSEESKIHK